MFAANTYTVRLVTADDATALCRLAGLDSSSAPKGPALIGEIDGVPAAAMSLLDGRVIADPFQHTEHLIACLRVRAGALRSYEAMPSLGQRMLMALRVPSRLITVPAALSAEPF